MLFGELYRFTDADLKIEALQSVFVWVHPALARFKGAVMHGHGTEYFFAVALLYRGTTFDRDLLEDPQFDRCPLLPGPQKYVE